MRPLLLFLIALPLAAQTAVPLDEALDRAHTQAIDVLRADAQIESARVSVEAARDRRWPALSLDLGGGQRYGLSFDQTSGDLTQSTVESMDVGVSASYLVFDGNERRAETRSAEATLRAAELNRARAEQVASAAVLRGYLAVAQAEAARAVSVENVAAEEELLRVVEAQVEMGERPAFEVAQQQERVATARASVVAAERDREIAEARLVRLLGLDPSGAYTFPVPPPADGTVPGAEALAALALDQRTDLRAAEVAVEAAEADGRAARASRLPQVSVGAYVGTSYSSAGEVTFPGQIGDNRAGSLRLGVSLPILDRGQSRQRIRQAEARATALRAEQADAERAVALEVRELRIELDALDAQAELAEVRVAAAEAALDAERARYEGGETTLQSVSQLQARLVEARTERERIRVAARFQRRLIDVAVGM